MLFLYFVYIAYFKKFAREALCLQKNFCSWKNQKGKKVLCKKKRKKEKKKQAQGRKDRYHSVEEIKKFLCESDWNWRKELAVKLNFATNNVKN